MLPFRKIAPHTRLPSWLDRFGIRSTEILQHDLREILKRSTTADSITIGVSSLGLLRPSLSLPAYLGFAPANRVSPIFNLFDRVGGGHSFRGVATRRSMRDYRGGRLSYDEHDGVDFVCPPGTPIVAAAPGVFVCTRDTWLRGGLTACIDHGHGVVTQYTHLAACTLTPGQRIERGDVLGLSGHAGIDMTVFFPWVPPHLHFSVWIHGRPIDPYVTPDETRVAGTWLHTNDPLPVAPGRQDEGPFSIDEIPIDREALSAILAVCRDPRTQRELERAHSDAARVAIAEDSLHHHRAHWPAGLDVSSLRPARKPESVRLTLPLHHSLYDRAEPADSFWTRPPSH